MALTSYEDLKQLVEDQLDELRASEYPEDNLTETADSLVPIYYNEIVEEWSDLPAKYRDSWQEFGYSDGQTIYNLMAIDLYSYYKDELESIWLELRDEDN